MLEVKNGEIYKDYGLLIGLIGKTGAKAIMVVAGSSPVAPAIQDTKPAERQAFFCCSAGLRAAMTLKTFINAAPH